MKPRVAKAIIYTPDGYLLNLRDNLDGFIGAGQWDMWGGAIESGESAIQACEREVKEEIGLALAFKPLFSLYGIAVFYVHTSPKPSQLVLGEGAAYAVLRFDRALRAKNVEPFTTLSILYHHFHTCKGRALVYSPQRGEYV